MYVHTSLYVRIYVKLVQRVGSLRCESHPIPQFPQTNVKLLRFLRPTALVNLKNTSVI